MVSGIKSENYETAKTLSDDIFKIATDLETTFNRLDANMNNLHENVWQSAGSSASRDSYDKLRRNYEAFYNLVVQAHDNINATQDVYADVDSKAKTSQTAITDNAKIIN